eukprot:CAMPEP_0180381572 /NCGR_PEP_ID=MMETSP0989-20121125/26812_1 /TAXON_ID=697907 /ORGANISM="non described non described, Strain CCMP2293" /LENGTH=65 /DNA_ID=CAMNT_0022381447 /DNA_START=127 /DNA_END=320 /DNA_ORIENTATION=+
MPDDVREGVAEGFAGEFLIRLHTTFVYTLLWPIDPTKTDPSATAGELRTESPVAKSQSLSPLAAS